MRGEPFPTKHEKTFLYNMKGQRFGLGADYLGINFNEYPRFITFIIHFHDAYQC